MRAKTARACALRRQRLLQVARAEAIALVGVLITSTFPFDAAVNMRNAAKKILP
jgi:hypothetical protein